MTVVNGYETIFGATIETSGSEGTPVEVGAGDGFELRDGATIEAKKELVVNDDALKSVLTKNWLNPMQAKATLPLYLFYPTIERFFAVLMGAVAGPTAHPDGNPKAYVVELKRAALSRAITLAYGLGQGKSASSDIVRVAEMPGVKFKSAEISQDNGKAADLKLEAVGKELNYDSTTNTATTILNVTAADASYPARPAVFDDLDILLTHQDDTTFDSTKAIDASGFVLTINTGVEDALEKNQSTKGGLVPTQTGRRDVEFKLTFLRDNDDADTIRDYAKCGEKLKALISYASANQGIPGASISGASPSTDISGSSNTNLKVKFSLTCDATGTTTEEHEITLTTGSLTTGSLIAAAIQSAIRAETATDTRFQRLLDNFICDYNSTVSGKYYLSVDSDDLVDVEVVAASSADLAPELKLGTANGGTEPDNVPYGIRFYLPEVVFSPPGEDIKGGVNEVEFSGRAMAGYSDAPTGFTTSDDDLLASDLAYPEDVRIVVIGRNSTSPFA